MYYPYFRGKQFELILLRDNSAFIKENRIHPIIEPVKNDFSALNRALKALCDTEVNCSLIINPRVPQEPVPTSIVLTELFKNGFNKYKNLYIGYILQADSKIDDLIFLLQKYHNLTFSILHYGYTDGKKVAIELEAFKNIKAHIFVDGKAGKLYQRHLKKDGIKRVLIRNGFNQQKKNAHYPNSEHFSDLHITYPDEGMDGFGDYLIVGDDYSEVGGPAYAVAIHLTYLDNDNDMFIYHFISDQTDSPTDPGGKFLEALEKLVKEIKKPKTLIYQSKACKEFLELYEKKHYPGLGYVKKLSMQHHIELIAQYLSREK